MGKVDSTWAIFWQFMAAALGLSMTAVTAFRSLFISHQVARTQGSPPAVWRLYKKSKEAMRRTFTFRTWLSKSTKDSTTLRASEEGDVELGSIECGTITGLRSFIAGYRKTKPDASRIMQSTAMGEEDDTLPLSEKITASGSSRANDKILAKPEKVRVPRDDHKYVFMHDFVDTDRTSGTWPPGRQF